MEGVEDALPADPRHRGNSPGSMHLSTLSLDLQTGVAWGYLCADKVGFKEIYFQVSNFPMPLLLTPNAFSVTSSSCSLSFRLAFSGGWRKASL